MELELAREDTEAALDEAHGSVGMLAGSAAADLR
jgi:hypothetical protein